MCNCNNCNNHKMAQIGKCGFFCKLLNSKIFKAALIIAFPVAESLYTVYDTLKPTEPTAPTGGNTDTGNTSSGSGSNTNSPSGTLQTNFVRVKKVF